MTHAFRRRTSLVLSALLILSLFLSPITSVAQATSAAALAAGPAAETLPPGSHVDDGQQAEYAAAAGYPAAANAPQATDSEVQPALADKVILFAADGMRPDMLEDFAADGYLPTFAQILAEGTHGANGMMPIAPANTGAGWYAMASGAFPGEFGSTNNTFHRNATAFTGSTSAFTVAILTADTLLQSANRAGKRVLAFDWSGGRNISPTIAGPAIDFRSFYSNRGVAINYALSPTVVTAALASGLAYEQQTAITATGWITEPVHFGDALEMSLVVTSSVTITNGNVTRPFYLYLYDSDNDANFDTLKVVPNAAGRDTDAAVATLQAGEWADIKVNMTGNLAGHLGGFYVKLIELAGDGSQIKVYFTSITRAAGNTPALELAFNDDVSIPSATAADFAPLQTGLVDEDTYVEQANLYVAYAEAGIDFLFNYYPDPDLVLVGVPTVDELQHQFLGLITPAADIYDDADRNSVADGRAAIRTGYVRGAYIEADTILAHAKSLMPPDTTVFVGSDHGFAPTWKSVNASRVLVNNGLQRFEQTSNCRPNTTAGISETMKACYAGAALQIYFNLVGRDPAAGFQVPAAQYALSQTAVISAFMNLTDPLSPTRPIVQAAFRKGDTDQIPAGFMTVDMLHPTRTGDVVIFLEPPYQFDAATAGVAVANAPFFGQHGQLPDTVDLARGINLHASFLAWGPPIKDGTIHEVSQIDLAPTIAFLMGIPSPAQSRGRILYEMIQAPAAALTADFITTSPDLLGETTTVFNQSGGGSGTRSYEWNFGDGTGTVITTTNGAIVHTYAALGQYTVVLTATDTLSATADVATRLVNILTSSLPVAAWLPVVLLTSGAVATAQSDGSATRGGFLVDVTGSRVWPGFQAPAPAATDLVGSPYQEVRFATVSDFHGQLPTLSFTVDGRAEPVGGAPALATLFDILAAQNQGGTLYLTGGDSVGASPPQSAEFDDEPTILSMNEWGFDADGLGNHNFDGGLFGPKGAVTHAGQANFPYLSANLNDPQGNPPDWLEPYHIFDVDGIPVAIIGLTNLDAPTLVKPGSFGDLTVGDQSDAVERYLPEIKAQGVKVIAILVHDGATVCGVQLANYLVGYNCTGPLVDLANELDPADIDVIMGDHTDFLVNQITNGILLTENRSKGASYGNTILTVDTRTGRVVYKTAQHHRPYTLGVAGDAAIQQLLDFYTAQLAPIFTNPIGASTVVISRTDSCGRSDGRLCESLLGNTVTDAMRETYGADFALTNSGGLRADLTCPVVDNLNDFCNPFVPPPFPISRGQVNTVLPFGNYIVTLSVHGAELKTMLENGVSSMPGANGRFPQVSGLCFTYNISNTVGTRVISATHQLPSGSCGGAPVDLTSGTTYFIAENDFMVVGGDGYPNFSARATSRDIMDQMLADYITAQGTLSPVLEGRIVCTANVGQGACPVFIGP